MKTVTTVLLLLFSFAAAVAADNDETKAVQSKDKCIQVTLPKGWKSTAITEPLPDAQEHCIAATSPDGDRLIVMTVPKLDFNSLKEVAEIYIAASKEAPRFEDKVVTEPRTVKVNGQDALQFSFQGTVDKVRIAAISTFIESPTRWNHIRVYTDQSRVDKLRDQIDAINKSFKELPKDQPKESPKTEP